MSVNTSDCSKHLEKQMENMCNYLEKLVTSDDGDEQNYDLTADGAQGYSGIPDLNKSTHQAQNTGGSNRESYRTPVASDKPPRPTPFNISFVGASSQYPQNMVTSVLASTQNGNGATSRFATNSTPYPRMKKRMNPKQTEKIPDTSGIDIDATMKQLALTPESFTQNEVHKLFSLFSDLEFSIHAEFITTSVYDKKTIPNNLSVSSQTKHAIWSCHKLLRSLREVLERPMPAEYKSAFNKCEEALGELQQAISILDRFKHSTLKHRKGEFINAEAKEHLQTLMRALNHITECVEQSRMYIQIYEQALNNPERYKLALLKSYENNPQPLPEEIYTEAASTSRSVMARRYIG